MSFEACTEQLRVLLQRDPSRATFLEVCSLVERSAAHSLARTAEELVPELRPVVEVWPARMRMAPLPWINDLIAGTLPLAALHLCTAMTMTGAMEPRSAGAECNRMLLAWLAALPPDVAALAGVSYNSTSEVRVRAFASVSERRARDGLERSIPLKCFLEDPPAELDTALLLRSPLCRAVRVLDLSIDAVDRDLFQADQHELVIGDLCLLEVLSLVPSKNVEVVNLYGQLFRAESQLGTPAEIKRRRWGTASGTCLTALNLSGGHPVGDTTLRQLAKLCPNLRELSIVPGNAAMVFDSEVYNTNEWDHKLRDWNLLGDNDQMLVSSAGIKALNGLRELKRLEVADTRIYEDDAGNLYRDRLRKVRDAIRADIEVTEPSGRLTKVATWSNYFDT